MKLNKLWLIVGILFLSMPFIQGEIVDDHIEQECVNGVCTATVYGNVHYYRESGAWSTIDTTFDTQNCRNGYQFCVDRNLYQLHVQDIFAGYVLTQQGSPAFGYVQSFIQARDGAFYIALNATNGGYTRSGNKFTYSLGNDLSYQILYNPSFTKDTLIIRNPFSFLDSLGDQEIIEFFYLLPKKYTYQKIGGGIRVSNATGYPLFIISSIIVQDATLSIIDKISLDILYKSEQPYMVGKIKAATFKYNTYPLYIDPIISTGVSSKKPTIDLVVSKNGTTLTRYDGQNVLVIGRDATCPTVGPKFRAVVEFNLSSISKFANVIQANFKYNISNQGIDEFRNFTLYHMSNTSFYYADNNTDNGLLWSDMGDGLIYGEINTSVIGVQQSLTLDNNSFSAINKSFGDPSILLGIGMKNNFESLDLCGNSPKMWASETADGREPVLVVTYQTVKANESEGDAAIRQGIRNALPSAIIYDEQQVYTRNVSNTQKLGKFDEFAMYSNKRWAFNYITMGESYTNMNNISNVLYVVEITNLPEAEITRQVEVFINATK